MAENVSQIKEWAVSSVSFDTVSKVLPNPAFKRLFLKFFVTKRRTMAAAVGMVSKRTRTSPCWDDEVDAGKIVSESGG